jgi:hypothetical protein
MCLSDRGRGGFEDSNLWDFDGFWGAKFRFVGIHIDILRQKCNMEHLRKLWLQLFRYREIPGFLNPEIALRPLPAAW